MAPKVERLLAEGDFHGAENLLALPNTHFANLMDEPALSLPSGPPGSA